ncbi:bifunctional (p)ppGpp synthetase/guanosine-3',5'-bis(diphosphate) 3'-pyrophosphohydrolase [Oscillospiraceae bacterium HV4-5-C5C]|nr:bifunctional (p)ppGpp synthetase/guanosine-3',5'-bis(diphosphate) 3'-pyrophosphohydrolase [Oscillospiraceae bacterium HV4-5-C5C]
MTAENEQKPKLPESADHASQPVEGFIRSEDELEEDLEKTIPSRYADEVRDAILSLLKHYKHYNPNGDESRIYSAVDFALESHGQQKRASGEPYIIHPLAVADIVTELEPDDATLIAALLHDTVEDTPITKEKLVEAFGPEVQELVDGVTKLDKMSFNSREEMQAENFRKMFLAMAKDIRVVWIKLADRLHNMRTLKHVPREKQKRIAQETLDIYAPLANRLGIYRWKWEMEDICLRYLDPNAYYELVGAISQRREEREAFLDKVVLELKKAITAMGIRCEIEGRPKHFYSIYRKMKTKDKNLDQIYDLFACRIIVDKVADCYAVLGQVHEMYKPIPGRFKDYIAMPKPNMYQSLHTTVIGSQGIPFEVQIRTVAMHRTAEFGLAAHWKYKENEGKPNPSVPVTYEDGQELETKLSWLRQLLDWQKDMRDASEYMQSLREGLITEEVFVFTPRGDVISLPTGSVPIDLAYQIHSGIGNHMYGAKVNGRIVPLTYKLQNGDIVEILTSDRVQGPSRDWLKIVKSSGARSKINQWFKRVMRDENISRGKESFERELKKSGFTAMQLMKPDYVNSMLQRYNQNSLDDLYAAIGHGTLTAGKVIPRLRDEYIKSLSEDEQHELGYRISSGGQVIYAPQTTQVTADGEITVPQPVGRRPRRANNSAGIIVAGMDNCLVYLSRCCSPVPGDPIIGFVTRGKGVAVHRKDCKNIANILAASADSPEASERASRLIDVYWDEEDVSDKTYQVELKILANDRNHLLGDVSNAIAEEKVSIISGSMNAYKDATASLQLTVEVNSQAQVDRVMGRIKAVRDIIDVQRGS